MVGKERSLTDRFSSDEPEARPPADVVPLELTGAHASSDEASRVTPPGRLHGFAIAGMAVCALAGIGAVLAFMTISWPGTSGRYVVAIFVTSVVGFLASGSTAVLTAARDTYPDRSKSAGSGAPGRDQKTDH